MRSFIAALCLSLASLSSAHADDPYTITGVDIDATSSNALEAYQLALREGQREAARRLVRRLTLAEDRVDTPLDLQPHMDEYGEMQPGFALSDAIIAEMISGLEIRNEQRSATRYLAELDVSFHRRSVARVMDAYGVPFVESQSRPMLVLPVFEGETGFQMFESNPWRAAWRQNFSNALTPMYVPSRAAITARQALELDETALLELARSQGVNRIAVLRAGERGGARRFGGYLVEVAADGSLAVETWGPQTVYGDWNTGARDFVADREEAWKVQSVVRDGEETELRVTVMYSGLPEWRRLQQALTRASLVQNAQLDALSRDGARMTVSYRGAFEQLVSELAERGATLEEHPGLGWVVLTTP
ncbi:DUF2066 domain-containing protein [Maricaulis parjimensis]|uniref:DUF2066 domain-containing protein n=1 Tax=Maricaulis parjimensis TaxID=144023 RepID=UPI0019399EDB|nr:DUF2066 domain-containing protein [Maricaulis parjimensis]